MIKESNFSIKWLAALLVMVMAASASLTQSTHAADTGEGTEKITLSPSSRTLKEDAGNDISGTMKVINDGDVAYDFTVYARPYSVTGEQYNPDFTANKSNTDLYKWVRFEKTKYSIEPGQTVEVKYMILIPKAAAPGGHYGVLFAETQARDLASTGVARQKRVGKVIYATVNGEYKITGAFKEFILPFWQNRAPMISSARVENTGNVDFRATVTTTAKDLFGQTKFSYTGDPIVLPDTTRLIEMNWQDAPNFGLFRVSQSVAFLDQKQQSSSFVLIAPKWALVVLIVMLSAGAAYAVLQRRTNRR